MDDKILKHLYDVSLAARIVWGTIEEDLDNLLADVDRLMKG